MNQPKNRLYPSSAYIDSTLVVALIVGLVAFAIWIAWETAHVINPWWLGGSIVTIGLYQMSILWLMRQYWSVNRVFIIFIINIASLGLLLGLVGLIFDVRLPVDLPILNIYLYLAGIEAKSFSPGSVAVSYAVLGIVAGVIVMLLVTPVENLRLVQKMKKWLRLDRLDLKIDLALDRCSFIVENTPAAWLVVPTLLFLAVSVVVVGSASLL